MARASTIYRDKISYAMQLVLDDKGGARMTRVPGKLAANERALELTIDLPLSIFTRPTLKAEIAVAAGEVSVPPIKVEAMRGAIRDAFGADVILTIDNQEQPS